MLYDLPAGKDVDFFSDHSIRGYRQWIRTLALFSGDDQRAAIVGCVLPADVQCCVLQQEAQTKSYIFQLTAGRRVPCTISLAGNVAVQAICNCSIFFP